MLKIQKKKKRNVSFADDAQTTDRPKKYSESDDDWRIEFSLTDLREDTAEDSCDGTFTFSVSMNTNDDRNAETQHKSGTGGSKKIGHSTLERKRFVSNNAFNTRLLKFTDEISWTKRRVAKREPTEGKTHNAVTRVDNNLDGKSSNVTNVFVHPGKLHGYINADNAGQEVSKQQHLECCEAVERQKEQTIQYYLDKVMQKPFNRPITEIRKQRPKSHI